MSIAAVALLFPLILLGGLMIFFFLRFLHRRLRLFTRGTIAFMTFVLVTFTVIDLVVLAQEIRDQHHRIKEDSIRGYVGTVAHCVLDTEEMALPVKQGNPGVEREVARIRAKLFEEIDELDRCGDAEDYVLACYDVRRASSTFRRLAGRHLNQRWEVDAVLVHPGQTQSLGRGHKAFKDPILCQLTIHTLVDDEGDAQIAAIDAETVTRKSRHTTPAFVWRSSDWTNPKMDETFGRLVSR
jgi:hypothetical protein